VQAHILDNAGWASLTGSHALLAEVCGLARRYPVEVSPFGAIADDQDPQAWRDLAELIGPDQKIVLSGSHLRAPETWHTLFSGSGVQLIGDEVEGHADHAVLILGSGDVPEMLDLVSRTKPGPFLPRTIELGGYIGFRIDGKLVAMAGYRLHPNGWREISAVCTDSRYQGQGLAGRIVRALVANIKAEGDIPFLHASITNTNAIRLYENLGFRLRVHTNFAQVQAPSL
jgi:ribosomal protein S18 acetylase RimI-like enzyme